MALSYVDPITSKLHENGTINVEGALSFTVINTGGSPVSVGMVSNGKPIIPLPVGTERQFNLQDGFKHRGAIKVEFESTVDPEVVIVVFAPEYKDQVVTP